ncbi:MAG: hypothetical protein Q9218_007451 [Villophora microphyllina]
MDRSIKPRWPYDLPTLKWLYPISDTSDIVALPGDHEQLEPATSFPFDKLPPELRLHVFHFAMPQYGLRPTPQPGEDYDDSDSACHDYATKVYKESMTPIRLLSINRLLSSEAAEVLYKEVLFRIDIEPNQIRFLHGSMGTKAFPSHCSLTRLSAFNHMEHFYLNIKMWKGSLISQHYSPSTNERFQENLRTIADALFTNEHIKSLRVAVPCYCARMDGENSPQRVCDDTNRILEPLKRLRVLRPVEIVMSESCRTPESRVQCTKTHWIRMKQDLEASFAKLEAAPLSDMEAAWKNLKALPRPFDSLFPREYDFSYYFQNVLTSLFWGNEESFDECAETLRRTIEQKWNALRPRQEREKTLMRTEQQLKFWRQAFESKA